MKKFILTIIISINFVLFSKLASQNLITSGNMESAGDWDTAWVISQSHDINLTYNFTQSTPYYGEGGCLYISSDASASDGLFNLDFLLFHPVTLTPGKTYYISGAIKDVTLNGLNGYWSELAISPYNPKDSLKNGATFLLAFNYWLNDHDSKFDWTYQDGSCRYLIPDPDDPGGEIPNPFFHVPDDLVGDQTYYIIIENGTYDDRAVDRSFKIVIDEISIEDSAVANITHVGRLGADPIKDNEYWDSFDWSEIVSGNGINDDYSSEDAVRIARNVMLYQKECGGWPKNTDIHFILTQSQKDALIASKPSNSDVTIDNQAVRLELTYLSRVYKAISSGELKDSIKSSFLSGIQYLLNAQYDNGGWPQFYPLRGGYSDHITYNDNAMVNAMNILRHIYQKDDFFSITAADTTVAEAKIAFDKGLDCILKSQYNQNGKLTSWCAQHHYSTLQPVIARSYELPSLSGYESVSIMQLLMSINNPTYEVKKAVYASLNWYDEVRIKGKRIEYFKLENGDWDYKVVDDPSAPDMWGRFMNLDDNRAFFCDRDGVKKYSVSEISWERRNNYRWYIDFGEDVFNEFNIWKPKWGVNTDKATILTAPLNNTKFPDGNAVPVKIYGSDDLQKFELYLDGNLIHDFSASEIDTFFAGLSVGEHKIVAKSFYNDIIISSDSSSFTILPLYNLTVNNGSGSGKYTEETIINIVANEADSGKIFYKWTGDTIYLEDVSNANTKVTMPAKDITLTATYKEITSITYNEIAKTGIFYPNPAASGFTVTLGNEIISTIEIYNLQGKLVYSAYSDKSKHLVENHNLTSGLYLVKVINCKNQIYCNKLIIE